MYSLTALPTTILLVLMSVAPGILIAWYVYSRDRYEKEPRHLLVGCFLLGMLGVVPPVMVEILVNMVGFQKSTDIVHLFVHAFFVVALVEESTKFFILTRYAYPKEDFNEPFDGITYSVMVSMGFATLENLMYVLSLSLIHI